MWASERSVTSSTHSHTYFRGLKERVRESSLSKMKVVTLGRTRKLSTMRKTLANASHTYSKYAQRVDLFKKREWKMCGEKDCMPWSCLGEEKWEIWATFNSYSEFYEMISSEQKHTAREREQWGATIKPIKYRIAGEIRKRKKKQKNIFIAFVRLPRRRLSKWLWNKKIGELSSRRHGAGEHVVCFLGGIESSLCDDEGWEMSI